MDTTTKNIDYKTELEKALSINNELQLTIQTLQLELIKLKKYIFGSRHENLQEPLRPVHPFFLK